MYNNNNEIHKFPSFVFGEINSHQTWGVQMGTLQGYSVHNPCNISRDHSPTHCWLKCPFQGKATALSLHVVETLANINVRYSGNELVTSGTGIILFTYIYIQYIYIYTIYIYIILCIIHILCLIKNAHNNNSNNTNNDNIYII